MHVDLHQASLGEATTLPPEDRYQGSVAGEPTEYEHLDCGARTEVPEEVVRTYLADPSFYGDRMFCSGCERDVPQSRCVWVDTGEDLQTYIDRLIREGHRRG